MIAAFWTVWQRNNWYDIAAEQLLALRRAGFSGRLEAHLVESSEEGAHELRSLAGSAGVQLTTKWTKENCFEFSALSSLKNFCDNTAGEHEIVYFHAKNVTLKGICGTKWRWAMNHAVLVDWRRRVEDLQRFDVAGFCHIDHPSLGPIFGGNFWWSTAAWIRGLPKPVLDGNRFLYEQWLLSRPSARIKSLVADGGAPHTNEFYALHGNPQDRFISFLAGV